MFCGQKLIKDVENRGNNQKFGATRYSSNIGKKWDSNFFSVSSTDNRNT